MSTTAFQWDENKARRNASKHGISFDQAARIFLDDWSLAQFDDGDHGEHRQRAIGVADGQTLFVAFTTRGESIRLISARRATRDESTRYWKDRLLRT